MRLGGNVSRMTSSTRTPFGALPPGEGNRITISRRCLHGAPLGSKPLLILFSKTLTLFLSTFTSTETPPHDLLRRNCGRARPRVRVPNLAIASAWRAASPSICSYERSQPSHQFDDGKWLECHTAESPHCTPSSPSRSDPSSSERDDDDQDHDKGDRAIGMRSQVSGNVGSIPSIVVCCFRLSALWVSP